MTKVKRSFPLFGTTLWIKVKRGYSSKELLELMQQNFGDKYGSFEIGGILNEIRCNGVNGYRISVLPGGNAAFGYAIAIRQNKKMPEVAYTLSGCIFGLLRNILDILTLGVAHWQIWGFRKNRHIMIPLGEDIAKIVQE